MNRYSLRLRLLIGAGIAIFLALLIAWQAMSLLFERHIERRTRADLEREALQLVANISDAKGPDDIVEGPTDARFKKPGSGLYWQVLIGDRSFRSRSLWDQSLDSPADAPEQGWRFRMKPGRFEHQIYVVERRVRADASLPAAVVQVAQDAAPLHKARNEFDRELALSLALLWVVLAAAAWFQVTLGLRPLGGLQAAVLTLKRRPGERLDGRYPIEIGPLVDAINELADARENDVRRARQRAADLAHGLKTPLAALQAQSRLIGADSAASTDGLDTAIARASAAVETELARARAAASRHAAHTALSAPAEIGRGLMAVLERTEKGMRIDMVNDVDPYFLVPVDSETLTEILGALLENAVKFARREVRLWGGVEGEQVMVGIDDDGPGLSSEAAERALARGVRLDERSAGHGLGLAIAGDLIEATGGTITFGSADSGGLAVAIRWPR